MRKNLKANKVLESAVRLPSLPNVESDLPFTSNICAVIQTMFESIIDFPINSKIGKEKNTNLNSMVITVTDNHSVCITDSHVVRVF